MRKGLYMLTLYDCTQSHCMRVYDIDCTIIHNIVFNQREERSGVNE